MAACGCLIPTGHKITSGHKYTKEAIEFLDLPEATRAEAIATLGPPLWESEEWRVLMYHWEAIPTYLFIMPIPSGSHRAVPGQTGAAAAVEGDSQFWALFIAYDERGLVSAHEARKVVRQSPEEACSEWARRSRTKR